MAHLWYFGPGSQKHSLIPKIQLMKAFIVFCDKIHVFETMVQYITSGPWDFIHYLTIIKDLYLDDNLLQFKNDSWPCSCNEEHCQHPSLLFLPCSSTLEHSSACQAGSWTWSGILWCRCDLAEPPRHLCRSQSHLPSDYSYCSLPPPAWHGTPENSNTLVKERLLIDWLYLCLMQHFDWHFDNRHSWLWQCFWNRIEH